jgi:hypothetical protein
MSRAHWARGGLESDTGLDREAQEVPSHLHKRIPALVAQGIEHRFPNFTRPDAEVQVAASKPRSAPRSSDRR